jgi:hypothetical protein
LKDAKLVFEGAETDMGIWGMSEIKEKKLTSLLLKKHRFTAAFITPLKMTN